MPLTVYTPRWRDLLNRLFVGKRQGLEDLVVLDDVFPILSLTDSTQGEYHLPRGEFTWSSGFSVPALGAARWGQAVILNPAGSGMLVVVEGITINTTAAFTTRVNVQVVMNPGAAVATPQVCQRTDTRGQAFPGTFFSIAPPATIVGYNDVGAALAGWIVNAAPSQNVDTNVLAHDVVLRPGAMIFVQLDSASANLAYGITVNGYDRQAEPEDLR